MKHSCKILLGSLLLTGLLAALSGCGGGYVAVSDGYYYGPGYHDPWFHDGGWTEGHRGYSEPRHSGDRDVYINPPRLPSPPRPPGLPHPH